MSIVLARYLGPTNNGRFAVLITIIALTQLVAGMGYPTAIVYHGARRKGDNAIHPLPGLASTALVLALGSSALVLAIFACVTHLRWFGGFLHEKSLSTGLIWIAVCSVPPYLLFQFMRQVLRSQRRIGAFNAVTVLQAVGVCVIVWLALALFGSNLTWAISAYTIGAAVAAVVTVWLVWRMTTLSLKPDRALARSMTTFGARIYVGTIFQFLNYKLDLLIVTALAGATQAGYYVVAVVLAERLWDLPSAVRIALQPHVTSAPREDAIAITAKFCRMLVALTLLAVVALLALGKPLIRLLFGSEYLPSHIALTLLVPGAGAFASSKLLAAFLASRGHPTIPSIIAAVGVAISVPLNLLLIPRWGIAGCAVASSITYTCLSAMTMTIICRRYGVAARDLLFIRRGEIGEHLAKLRIALRPPAKGDR